MGETSTIFSLLMTTDKPKSERHVSCLCGIDTQRPRCNSVSAGGGRSPSEGMWYCDPDQAPSRRVSTTLGVWNRAFESQVFVTPRYSLRDADFVLSSHYSRTLRRHPLQPLFPLWSSLLKSWRRRNFGLLPLQQIFIVLLRGPA
jgi:hypothetical protein